MNVIIERDNGRIEQIISDAPLTVYVVDTGSDKHTGDSLTSLPSGEEGLVQHISVIVDPESAGNILQTFNNRSEDTHQTVTRYVITKASTIAQTGTVFLETPLFVTGWENARRAAFDNFIDSVKIGRSADSNETIKTETPNNSTPAKNTPTREQLDAQYPLLDPVDFRIKGSSNVERWMVAVTAVPE